MIRLEVRVHPRASRARVEWDGSLAGVWVAPPAADGRANHAVVRALAGWLGVPPSAVRIVAGARGRSKVVEVDGLEALPPPG